MIASPELARGSEEARLKLEGEGVRPHIVQIAGRDPALMAEAARIAQGAGADCIDINMGCPAKRVARQLCGSALMREPDLAERLVVSVAGAVSVPVTVKTRLGFDAASLNAPEIARRCEAAGARLVTIHGRTRAQFYTGRANWQAVAPVKQTVSVPVLVNGDIGSIEDARLALAQSGADAVMIGRAAVGRPWLVAEIGDVLAGRAPVSLTADERRAIAIEHHQELLRLHGTGLGLRLARKHLAAYAEHALMGVAGARALAIRAAIVRSDSPAEIEDLLRQAFDLGAESQPERLAA
jgi:nifR3 family TIM-barrel protein